MVINAAVKTKKNIRTIKAAVQLSDVKRHPRKFMGTLGGNPPMKMYGLGSSFKYEEKNYMLSESLKECELEYVEVDYEDPGEQAIMGFMASGGEFRGRK